MLETDINRKIVEPQIKDSAARTTLFDVHILTLKIMAVQPETFKEEASEMVLADMT